MSAVKCDCCEEIFDAKENGIEGIYGDDAPYEYLCPNCTYEMACDLKIDVWDNEQVIIEAYRRRHEQYRRQDEQQRKRWRKENE